MMPDVEQELRNAYTIFVQRILLTCISNFGWYIFLQSSLGITSGNQREQKYYFMEQYNLFSKVFTKPLILKSKLIVSRGTYFIFRPLLQAIFLYRQKDANMFSRITIRIILLSS